MFKNPNPELVDYFTETQAEDSRRASRIEAMDARLEKIPIAWLSVRPPSIMAHLTTFFNASAASNADIDAALDALEGSL
jgi:hypothetical protein